MRVTSLIQRVASIAFALVVLSYHQTTALGQIVLRPSQDVALGQGESTVESSRRQRHVSREVLPGNTPRFEAPVAPTAASSLTGRAAEYEDLQREADLLQRQFNLVRRVVKFVSPSIVHIEATKRTDPGKGFASSRIEEAGAGVIIDIGGHPHVLTNRHVIHSAELNSIRLELNDGRQLRAVNVWTDASTDVAVLRLQQTDLIAARLGNSDLMEPGDFVLAVGSPFGLSHSVTYGILSAKGRRNLELGSREIEIQDFFQTDAAINPGNSGGPLLNLRGEIVGINTAIASNSGGNEGIGFSIPINMAVLVAKRMVNRGQLSRSYLGVQLENAFDITTAQRLGLRSSVGALVKDVLARSPAERAGVKVGDVILEFNSVRMQNDGHLVQSVGLMPVGSKVSIVVFRNGRTMRLSATLNASPDN